MPEVCEVRQIGSSCVVLMMFFACERARDKIEARCQTVRVCSSSVVDPRAGKHAPARATHYSHFYPTLERRQCLCLHAQRNRYHMIRNNTKRKFEDTARISRDKKEIDPLTFPNVTNHTTIVNTKRWVAKMRDL